MGTVAIQCKPCCCSKDDELSSKASILKDPPKNHMLVLGDEGAGPQAKQVKQSSAPGDRRPSVSSPSKRRPSVDEGEDVPNADKKIAFLSKVPIFKNLSDEKLLSILHACEEIKFSRGGTIIEQGDHGSDLYLIIKGETSVTVDGADVASLKAGDYFGETALLKGEARTATVRASGKVLVVRLTREAYISLGLQHEVQLVERATAQPPPGLDQQEAHGPEKPKRKSSHTAQLDDQTARRCKLLSKIPLFQELTNEMLQAILKIAKEAEYDRGQAIITQGDQGDQLFVLIKGETAVTVDNKTVAMLKSGDYFGERALLRDEQRNATIKATQAKVLVIKISRKDFEKLDLGDHLNLVEKG